MLAKEFGAIFQRTSAKESTGIDELFDKLGEKFLTLTFIDKENIVKEVVKKRKKSVKRDKNNINHNTKKKGCC